MAKLYKSQKLWTWEHRKRHPNWLKVSGMPIAPFRTSLSCYLSISISISISTIRYTCNLATVEDIVPPSTFSHSDSFGLSANTAQRTASPRAPNRPIREFYRTCWDAYLPPTQTLCPTLGTGGKKKSKDERKICHYVAYKYTKPSPANQIRSTIVCTIECIKSHHHTLIRLPFKSSRTKQWPDMETCYSPSI